MGLQISPLGQFAGQAIVPPHPSGTSPAHCDEPHASVIFFGAQTHAALFGSHAKPAGHAHIDVTPAELLSVNTSAGKAPSMAPMGQAGGSTVRLFELDGDGPSRRKEGRGGGPVVHANRDDDRRSRVGG